MDSKLNQVECQLEILGSFIDLGELLLEEEAVYKRKRFQDEKVILIHSVETRTEKHIKSLVTTPFASFILNRHTHQHSRQESKNV